MIAKTLRILFPLIMLAAFSANADETVKARRGDSWESIAAKYGIDPADLREANGNVPECFMGMEVVIPDDLIQEAKERLRQEQEEANSSFINGQLDLAERQIAMGKHKDAKKTYDKLIKSHPSTNLYFLRGLLEYDMHKWGKAMDDFSYVRRQNDCDADMREEANVFYAQAAKFKQEADEKKSQMIGAIFAVAATAAVVATTAVEHNKQQKAAQRQMASSSGSSRTREYSTSSSRVRSRNASASRSTSTSSHRRRASSNALSTRSSRSSGSTARESRGYSHSSYNSGSSYSSSPAPKVMSNSEWNQKIQNDYNNYLSPEAFMNNYMNGRPTLPTSQEMGLTGMDAYAYDLQANLLHREQLTNLAIAQQTEALIRDGQEKAAEEIRNFSSIYGREPTAEEMNAIYKKHTQGYIDAYAAYVEETVNYNQYSSGDGDNNPVSQTTTNEKQKCGLCGGTGTIVAYVANFGIDKQPWCKECGRRVVSGHYHKTCPSCKGKGEN